MSLHVRYAGMALVYATDGDRAEAAAWGRRAIELGEELGDTQPVAEALGRMGAAELAQDEASGREMLMRSIELARAGGHAVEEGAAYVYLVRDAGRRWRFDEADRLIDDRDRVL